MNSFVPLRGIVTPSVAPNADATVTERTFKNTPLFTKSQPDVIDIVARVHRVFHHNEFGTSLVLKVPTALAQPIDGSRPPEIVTYVSQQLKKKEEKCRRGWIPLFHRNESMIPSKVPGVKATFVKGSNAISVMTGDYPVPQTEEDKMYDSSRFITLNVDKNKTTLVFPAGNLKRIKKVETGISTRYGVYPEWSTQPEKFWQKGQVVCARLKIRGLKANRLDSGVWLISYAVTLLAIDCYTTDMLGFNIADIQEIEASYLSGKVPQRFVDVLRPDIAQETPEATVYEDDWDVGMEPLREKKETPISLVALPAPSFSDSSAPYGGKLDATSGHARVASTGPNRSYPMSPAEGNGAHHLVNYGAWDDEDKGPAGVDAPVASEAGTETWAADVIAQGATQGAGDRSQASDSRKKVGQKRSAHQAGLATVDQRLKA